MWVTAWPQSRGDVRGDGIRCAGRRASQAAFVLVDHQQELLRHRGGFLPHDRPERPNADHVADRPGHDQRYAIDNSKILELGWTPQYISIEDGLAQTIDWYSKYRDFWEADKLSVEQNYAKIRQK